MQAGGHRFDPDRLHQTSRMKIIDPGQIIDLDAVRRLGAAVFDIVNGFLIDAVAHWFLERLSSLAGAVRHLQM